MDSTMGMQQGRFVVPETVATHFHVRKGDVVGDFGTGTGFFLPILSKLVGSEGKIYACEIQKNLVESTGDMVRRRGLGNVEVLWSDVEELGGSKLNDSVLDVGLFVNVLFQLESKDIAIDEVFRTIRQGGKLFIIDWSESFNGIGPHPSQVITSEDVKALAEGHGFIFERSFDAGDHHYGLAFRKP